MTRWEIIWPLILFSFQISLKGQVFYKVERMAFNSSASNEMAPQLYKNGLVFSSDRKNDIVLVTVDQSGNFLYNLYFAEKKEGKNWSRPVLFSKNLLSRYNQSSLSISSDNMEIFYTSNQGPGQKVGDRLLDDTLKNAIFIAKWNNNDWINSGEFQYNSPDYDVANPCISEDGKRLYFASLNPKGYGGYDIYYCDNIQGKWSEPVNLGAKINSSESEVFPFIYNNQRLYFASSGLGGHGNLDIFYTENMKGEWQTPVVLPEPFNSRFDDFAYVSNALMDTGYFTSNRQGTDDIFRFVSTFPTFTECPEQVVEDYCYTFYEAGKMLPDTTTLKYEWDLGDGIKVRNLTAEHCYAEPGYYLIQLNVIDTLTGEIYMNEATYDLLIEKIKQPFIISPDTVRIDETVAFDGSETNIKDFIIQNYYWDFGDGDLGNDLQIEHKYTKPGNYLVRLGVTGTRDGEKNKLQKACAHKLIVVVAREK